MKLRTFALAGAALALAACSTNTGIAPITTNTSAILKLAVGTLNDSTGLLGVPGTYLNAVTSFRNPTGTTAFFHPGVAHLTGPAGLNESLGTLWAYGQAAGTNSTLGEPPAFSPPNSSGGYSTGYILTGAAATPGMYTVATNVSVSGQTLTFSASATLPASPVVLPPDPTPAWSSDGRGGGTIILANPPGVTESLIFFQSTANGNPYVASIEVKSPATMASVPDGMLPVGSQYYIFALGADYPLVEAAPPNSTTANPTLTGPNGTADLTTSGVGMATE